MRIFGNLQPSKRLKGLAHVSAPLRPGIHELCFCTALNKDRVSNVPSETPQKETRSKKCEPECKNRPPFWVLAQRCRRATQSFTRIWFVHDMFLKSIATTHPTFRPRAYGSLPLNCRFARALGQAAPPVLPRCEDRG